MHWKDLKVWEKAHALVLEIYKITSNFPKEELYGLTNQLKRSSASVAANIVEGQCRHTSKEYVQFLYNARGSLEETRYHLLLAKDLGYIITDKYKYLEDQYEEVSRMMNSLISKIKEKGSERPRSSRDNRVSTLTLTPLILISLALLALTPAVYADDLHYNNILVGDRAAGMGGAYTAISDDPSGLYYNPAGIVFAPGRSFSASVNAFQYSQKEYKDVLGGNGWERKSSNLQPNYFGIIQPLGEGKVGFSYAVPDSRLEDQDQTFYGLPGIDPDDPNPATNSLIIDRYVINMNDTDYTYNFGPSYAMKINDKVSIGTTLYLHYRDRELISNQLVTVDEGGRYEWNNVYGSITEWGVKPIVGAMWMPADKISVGLTMSKTFILDTERTIQTTCDTSFLSSAMCGGLGYGLHYNVFESDDNRELPLTATLGVAYFPSENLLLSADLTYYNDASYSITHRDKVTGAVSKESIPQEETVNVTVGAEYYPTERIALRGGLFTNMANTPELSSGKVNQPEHIDMYGASLSITRFTRASSLTLGGSYSMDADSLERKLGNYCPNCDFGSGEAQLFSGSELIQDVDMQNYSAFISAAFSY